MDCIPNKSGTICINCGWQWKLYPDPWPHHNCTNSPKLRPAADKLGLPDPLPPGLSQTVARYAAGQPLGPGDWLHLAILKWVGESPTRKCACQDRMIRMNKWGPAVCRERLDKIVGWMEGEAKKRGWWKYAVAVPGSQYFIKRMILKAIKNAEANQKLSSNAPSQQFPISSAGI